MKRKLVALLLAAALMTVLCASALATTTYYGTMMVDNCEEWVSLRDGPGTGCGRLAKVPLYAIVTDAEHDDFCGDFIYCCYDGTWGYIKAEYLVPWADPEPESKVVMDELRSDYRVRAEHTYMGEGEYLLVTCEDPSGDTVWYHESQTESVTELDGLTAFLGGADQDPLVMVYNAEHGLTALDFFTGETCWEVTGEYLGAGNSWAVSDDGWTYIGGYYGPDPVAIDPSGNVRWHADSEGCYWLYFMQVRGDELWCWYDVMDGDHEQAGEAIFGRDGALREKRYDR